MTQILSSRFQAITITTADPTGIQRDEIRLVHPGGRTDLVWDGAAFRVPYSALSSRAEVTPGQAYSHTLRRSGGWPTAFVIQAWALDVDGNEALQEWAFSIPALALPTPSPPGASEARRIGSGLTAEDGTPSGQVTDHGDQSIGNLIQYFQDKPRMGAVLRSWAAQVQEVEDALWALFSRRGISVAEGVWLDELGAIVGEPRQGRLDDRYRAAIRVRIAVNISEGRWEELLSIASRMIGPTARIQASEHPPASIAVRVRDGLGDTTGEDLLRMLRAAKSAGVSLVVGVASSSARSFRFGHASGSSGATPGSAPTSGWGTVNDGTAGGLWSRVL